VAVLLFSDVVGSTALKSRFGTAAYAKALSQHDALFKGIIGQIGGAAILKDTGDGFFAQFESAADAVGAALKFQQGLSELPPEPFHLQSRVGIHVGEVEEMEKEVTGRAKIVGLTADLAARVMGLAAGGQILMTRGAFDQARKAAVEPAAEGSMLRWIAHGRYVLKGVEDPVEVFEVGMEGVAPLVAPEDPEKGQRCVTAEDEKTLGWRPAVGQEVPGREGWILDKKLGEGGFGEVWLGFYRRPSQRRVFKFCFDAERLRSLKREMTLFKLLREALGDRPDITRLHEVKLDEPPFYLESEYTEGGNLSDWAARRGGLNTVGLAVRLDLVMATAEAVHAAHSVGVLHKDLKPSNILIYEEDGWPKPRLSDFGISMVTEMSKLSGRGITVTGFTRMTDDSSSRSGTQMYLPPELMANRPFTVQGDVYALGVFLYQMVVADLNRPLAQGWERDINTPELREDISLCVDGDPKRRMASAAELANRLRDLPERQEKRLRAVVTPSLVERKKEVLEPINIPTPAQVALAKQPPGGHMLTWIIWGLLLAGGLFGIVVGVMKWKGK
jgi:class 3 adenylate cyclase/tRNA A-37 threonylcarbamoyl transferase component Bud32